MKRIILILILYTAIIFGCCIGGSFIYKHLPTLLDNAIRNYTFLRGLGWFFKILPAVLISGFMIGCAIQWKSNTEDSREKFSPGMLKRYKHILLIGVLITCVLTFVAEVFLPATERRQIQAEQNPALLAKYTTLCNEALATNHPMLAWQYAEQAYAIYPKKPEVADLYKRAGDAKELYSSVAKETPVETIEHPIEEQDTGYTIKQLVDKSKKAADEKKWFESHYWATLAITACSGTDTNLSAATDAANTAWNNLNNPVAFDTTEQKKFYDRKKEGYSLLMSGDNLQAYYIFTELSTNYPSDPDVAHYFEISKERVEAQYFFIDEVADLKKVETKRNIYFSLPYSDGSRDIVYINGDVSLSQAGNVIRYLDGLTIVSYNKDGMLIKKMYVPYAKMIEEPTAVFGEEQKNVLGITKKVKSVPYIQLQSVDRTTKGVVCKPQYQYPLSSQSWFVAPQEESYLILPMPYSDFSLLDEASAGAKQMSYMSLIGFVTKSTLYGYSQEVFSQSLVQRGVYPLFLLILIVFAAAFAWNYRVGEKDLFRFSWLLLFPVFSFVVYILIQCCQYILTLLNYVFVGTCGSYALLVAFIVYVLLFFIVTMIFMARRSS
jgi:hypothetical protein